jgi:hypothetical protein
MLHIILLILILLAIFIFIHLALTKAPKPDHIMRPCGSFSDTDIEICKTCEFNPGSEQYKNKRRVL